MSWRYQPVFTEQDGLRSYSLCEVYFDAEGNFNGWTETEAIAPGGEEIEELSGDLARMMVDALSWEPVRFSDLKSGMVFRPRISMDERRRLADFVDHTKGAFKPGNEPKPN